MSKILTARDGIVTAMQGLAGTGERFQQWYVKAHGGEFKSEEELMAYAVRPPAAIVCALDFDRAVNEGWETRVMAHFGIFLVARDVPGTDRASMGLAMAENVVDYIMAFPTRNWGTCASAPMNCIARSLYSHKFDAKGLALWGVFWTQTVEIEPPAEVALDNFDTIHVDYDLYPRDNDADLGDVIDAEDDIT